MKKILLTFTLGVATSLAISQTINATNVVELGDTIYQAEDVSPVLNLGSAGTGNSWNFSSLLVNKRDTVVFTHPWTTPCAMGTFPNATHRFVQDTLFGYLSKSSSSLQLIGISDNANICVASQDSETVIEFPSSYGSTFLDTAKTTTTVSGSSVGQPSVDSIKVVSQTFIESDFNASGTLTISYGVFSCIRQDLQRITNSDVYGKSALTGGAFILLRTEKDTAYSHQYWSDAANAKFPLVSYDVDASGNLTGSVIYTLNFRANAFPFINENEMRTLSIFPNPATHQLNLEVEEPISTLVITDVSGKKVFSSNKIMNKQIDVSNLKKGIYFITIQTNSYSAISKFIKD